MKTDKAKMTTKPMIPAIENSNPKVTNKTIDKKAVKNRDKEALNPAKP